MLAMILLQLNFGLKIFLFYFPPQSTFSSVSPSSLDYLLLQQQQHQEELISQQQQSLQHLESSFSDILFSQSQQDRAFIEQQAQHSNSSSDTLVGIEEETSRDLLTPTIRHFKEEPPFLHTNPHTPTNPQSVGEQDSDLIFETSSTEELGLLSLRSSSDPILSHTSQRQAATDTRPQTSDCQLDPILPSFQETYPIKYNQLSDFGLKMDEDCGFSVATHTPQQQAYQQGHQHGAPYGGGHHHHAFGNPSHSEYIQNVGSFYQQHHHHHHHHPYDTHSLVSFMTH